MAMGTYQGAELNGAEIAALRGAYEEMKYHYVSFKDVLEHRFFKIRCKHLSIDTITPDDLPPGLLEKVLWDYGLDTNKTICRLFCHHRAYDGSVYTGPRWQGLMRLDRQWVKFIKDNLGIELLKTKRKSKCDF